jgi:hypothetical protein
MNKEEIEQMLISVVRELQELSGREMVNISVDTRPTEDIPGFDSLNCVEATIDAAGRISKEVKFNNVFFDGTKSLCIKEAATRLFDEIQK